MPANNFSSPPGEPAIQQHEVAAADNARRLMKAIPDKPDLLAALCGKHIVSTRHFDAQLLMQLFRRAAAFESGEQKPASRMTCKVLGGNFLDVARPELELTFRRAWEGLGGAFINLTEAVEDTLRQMRDPSEIAAIINNYSDFAVVYTERTELFPELLRYSQVPLINAGNGEDEAPAQALTDLYTLLKWRVDLLQERPKEERLRIGLFGTPGDTGTLRSLLIGLTLLPQLVQEVVLLDRPPFPFSVGQQEELENAGIKINLINKLYPNETVMGAFGKVIPELDVIYSHLKKHQTVINRDMLVFKSFFKPNLMLLSPQRQLPEFSAIINDSPHNGFFAQARGAVYIYMALMEAMMGQEGT